MRSRGAGGWEGLHSALCATAGAAAASPEEQLHGALGALAALSPTVRRQAARKRHPAAASHAGPGGGLRLRRAGAGQRRARAARAAAPGRGGGRAPGGGRPPVAGLEGASAGQPGPGQGRHIAGASLPSSQGSVLGGALRASHRICAQAGAVRLQESPTRRSPEGLPGQCRGIADGMRGDLGLRGHGRTPRPAVLRLLQGSAGSVATPDGGPLREGAGLPLQRCPRLLPGGRRGARPERRHQEGDGEVREHHAQGNVPLPLREAHEEVAAHGEAALRQPPAHRLRPDRPVLLTDAVQVVPGRLRWRELLPPRLLPQRPCPHTGGGHRLRAAGFLCSG
mmetsp:Transcript_64841/g.200815  ORF Transcript_64841/g.200815 Transcript_64841/m.200815 type:complete len:337 (+) Transcript_64841:388-1398(+)